ncbi:MAG: L-lactate permease, partial [Sandarakinorhabdus sp.]|nr:L-lactate permease [Sandarakinorhabdus sp.]
AAAGAAAAVTATLTAIFGFGYGSGSEGLFLALAGPFLEAVFTALTILWIIFAALAIHEYQTRSGAIGLLGRWLAGAGKDPRIAALLVAWFFALFLEGAAGFGTPVALAAPILVGLGFPPVRAVSLALIGHSVGVSFGAIGTPMVPLVAASALEPRLLSGAIMALHAGLGWMMAAWIYRLAGTGSAGTGAAGSGRGGMPLMWIGSAWAFFSVPAVAIAWLVGPELPTLGGALLGGMAFVALVRWKTPPEPAAGRPAARDLLVSAAPYAVILLLVLLTRLVEPLQHWLQGLQIEWTLAGEFGGTVALLYHPGTMLFAGLVIAGALRRGGLKQIGPAVRDAAARLPTVAAALVAVLLLAHLMVHAGMIDVLALGAAGALGGAWALAAPAAGALGTFVTGSATASNILLGSFQYSTALAAGVSPLLIMAAQGMGAAVGNIVAPHNIVAGAATVGLIGREGEVLKRTLPAFALYITVGGLLVFALSLFFPLSETS